MRAQRVLVTGATGFVGRHLVKHLLARGSSVRAVARNPETARAMPWFNEVEFVSADIHALDADVQALATGMDALVHLAWPGLPNYRDLFHFEHNLFADYRFIKHVIQSGVPQVLVTGTCFEYGMQSGPMSEETLPQPTNPYGLAKHTLRLFLEALQAHHPFVLQWVRLFYLHGAGQNPNSLLASLDRAIDSGAERFDMSAGDQLRDYLDIDIAAGYLADVLERAHFSGIVNCCSGVPISVRALVEARLRERNASIELNLGHYGYASHEPMAFWGDAMRLRALRQQDPAPLGGSHT
ncbi:NAD(P)-dependent oxidoreductase [Pseudomonas sp. NFACC02]|uniref:NAD-dependent epimerase/dehydratase family protein n=1 Tax=Pseudomonas sp. NFACC02 TaxID=1566250 RepID=UPI000B808C7D|nr:NAD(P)-dependent oxidoreductase [Pseudomonas sp. NFACC02]